LDAYVPHRYAVDDYLGLAIAEIYTELTNSTAVIKGSGGDETN